MSAVRLATVLIAAAAAGLVVLIVAGLLFDRRIGREIDALLADARPTSGIVVSDCDLERLPEPVQRWLRYSRVVGTARPGVVRLKQEGEFRLGGRWTPFAADQYFTIDPPAFLWKASFDTRPLLRVSGRDRYQHGEGSIDMRLASLIPVASKRGGGLDQGAMLRFLGEIQWFPAAALAKYARWESIDTRSARATMTDGGQSASMTFIFAADGRLMESRAMRYNDSSGRHEPWINRNHSEREFGEVRIPSAGEARWQDESGEYPYIRWRITEVRAGS